MARPRKTINWEKLDAMLQFGPSLWLCAKECGVVDNTLAAAIKRKHNMSFEEYKNKIMDKTRLTLQQKAIKMAMNGNATMMIFCLKNICKWSDRTEVTADIDFDGVHFVEED